jgi:hypothetical protein
MIWFDASLSQPADDGMLQRGIAAMLSVDENSVNVVHSIEEIDASAVTCVVEISPTDAYAQLITIYLPEALPAPDTLESASRLAVALDRSMLLVNDATANPYSFVHVSNAGRQSNVLVDPDQLDGKGRYVIREPELGLDEFDTTARSSAWS